MLSNSLTIAPVPESDPIAQKIIDATLEEVGIVGARRARLTDISKRAGVSQATLFRRFANKDALFEAVVVNEVQQFVTALQLALEPYAEFPDRVAEGFAFSFDHVRGHEALRRVFETEPDEVVRRLTTGGRYAIETSRDLLTLMVQSNAARDRPELRDEAWLRVRMEIVVRLFWSLLLTPEGAIDTSSNEATKEFARAHILPLFS
ncbi:MAG: TetR/AcrR family transcriptional regulator [Thermoleophilaceae bacterium]|nr:TetR/AcrR family transcriptional regulator [Thermoleophilaceae bacterium]